MLFFICHYKTKTQSIIVQELNNFMVNFTMRELEILKSAIAINKETLDMDLDYDKRDIKVYESLKFKINKQLRKFENENYRKSIKN